MVSWAIIRSLLLFFGPWLLPRAIGYYRRLQAEVRRQQQLSQQQKQRPPPPPPLTLRALFVLGLVAVAALAWLASTVSGAAAEPNVFALTQSRLQAPTDVIFTRLASLRSAGGDTNGNTNGNTNGDPASLRFRHLRPADEALRARFSSLESRLLYLQFGPAVLTECPFCGGTGVDSGGTASTYLFYALPALVAPHLANLALVALATSPLLVLGRAAASGPSAAAASALRRWRTPAALATLALAAWDLYCVAAYDRQANARALRLVDLDPFFWSMRLYRGLAAALLLAALDALLWMAVRGPSSSFLAMALFGPPPPPSPAHRVVALTRALAAARSKLSAGAILKNTVQRDAELRARTQAYWAREVQLMAAAMEEREVLEGIQDALQSRRVDVDQITRDADAYTDSVLPMPAMAAAEEETTPINATPTAASAMS